MGRPARSLIFRVEGDPKAQPRVKAYRRGNYTGVYTPDTARAWKEAIAASAIKAAGEVRFEGPLEVAIEFRLRRPERLGRSTAREYHVAKPDIDNLAKAVYDAIGSTGLWEDDAQIALQRSVKYYADYGAPSGATILIKELGGEE